MYELGWLDEAREMMVIYQATHPGSHDKDFTTLQEKIEKQGQPVIRLCILVSPITGLTGNKNGHSSSGEHNVSQPCSSCDFTRRFTAIVMPIRTLKKQTFLVPMVAILLPEVTMETSLFGKKRRRILS